jgi:malate dehydrogenase (oxaloacetate-decarboxylating)
MQGLSPDVLRALITGSGPVPVTLRGQALLAQPLLNKDLAFSEGERQTFGLRGLMPPHVKSIEEQVALELEHLRAKGDPLEQYIGLAALQDRNETLFYRVLIENLEEFLPIVYTPTVGQACEQFSHILRRSRGIWITPDDRDIDCILQNVGRPDIRLIVVTDNERILGLGDQGAGGMGIPIGKLALYSAAAGIHPASTLPISLDVGTDNPKLLDDPAYVGWRHPRLRGLAYDLVIEDFVLAVRRVFPKALIQWEDFKQHTALSILRRYRWRTPCFNDDIQGTAAVALAGVLAGLRHLHRTIVDQRFVLLGAGAAGVGMAELLVAELRASGVPAPAIGRSIAVLDSHGLIHAGRAGVDRDKASLAMDAESMIHFGLTGDGPFGLEQVIEAVQPTVLIGATAVAGTFDEASIRAMAAHTDHPIILAMSNPTAKVEATPEQLLRWTNGCAVVATGSPFPAVEMDGEVRVIGQANNVFIFPGVGIGAIVGEATQLPNAVFRSAARVLAGQTPEARLQAGALYPAINDLRSVARAIATETIRTLGESGYGRVMDDDAIEAALDEAIWQPDYRTYEPV